MHYHGTSRWPVKFRTIENEGGFSVNVDISKEVPIPGGKQILKPVSWTKQENEVVGTNVQ